MQKHYRYFFYDFDGMISDTYPHIARAFSTVLSEMRETQIDERQTYDLLKVNFQTAYDYYNVSPEEKERIRQRHENWFYEPIPTLFPDVKEVLTEGVRRGNRNIIYTNRGESVYEYLKRLDVLDCFFEFILHANKPDHRSLLDMVESRGLKREECVVIGDREVDMVPAHRLGIDGILFDPDHRVHDHHGTYVIRSAKELFDFL